MTSRLRPPLGLVVFVVGSATLEKVLTATMRAAFGVVLRVPSEDTNTVLVADGLQGGSVYTDDKAPVEWLVDASLIGVAADGQEE